MLITYFDEVKFEAGSQPYYWLGGLVGSAKTIWSLERGVAALSKECFGTAALSRATEFHAADIFHRKRNFKTWSDMGARLDVLKRLFRLIDTARIGKIYVKLNPAKMLRRDFEHMAFMFFVEHSEFYLRSQKSPGILIGDRESDSVSGVFSEALSRYRHSKTEYEFGIELTHLIDTVHFTDSHHSRMLQLADLYVWSQQLCATGNNGEYPRSELVRFLREETKLLTPTRYKEWPTEQARLQVSG